MILPRKRLFWAVGLGHTANDLFMSMGPVLLAFLSVTILPMSNTQIGFTVSMAQLLGGAGQPFFGLIADRTGGRWLGAMGVTWVTATLLLALVLAQTGQYWLMFLPFVLSALGSAAFHPVGTMYAAETDKEHVATNLSVFFLLGQSGLALGPALAGMLLDRANFNPLSFMIMGGMPNGLQTANTAPIMLLALVSVPSIILMATTIPNRKTHNASHDQRNEPAIRQVMAAVPVKPFLILAVMVTLRSLAQPGTVTFIPVLFRNKGWSPTDYGLITSSFWIAAGFAGVVFGNLADRYDRRKVIMASLLGSAPAFFLLPFADGGLAFVLAMLAGGLSGASHSIIVALAQDLIPASKGFASGAILGFIFGTGAVGGLVIGSLSDVITLETTFQVVAVVTVVASLLALALPARKKAEHHVEPLTEMGAVPSQP